MSSGLLNLREQIGNEIEAARKQGLTNGFNAALVTFLNDKIVKNFKPIMLGIHVGYVTKIQTVVHIIMEDAAKKSPRAGRTERMPWTR